MNTGSANAAREGGTSGEGKSSNQENASKFLKRLVLKNEKYSFIENEIIANVIVCIATV